MCGIVGFFNTSTSREPLESQILSMSSAVVHRGPDDVGVWVDKNIGLALGHRRLSVVDLSASGHQPMSSACGTFIIVFNGEIYNHLSLRRQLASDGLNVAWRGHSDTETLLECFSLWGVERTLKSVVGMFSIALWDKSRKVLSLARDRMGEKPLYWGWCNNTLLFGSELKALKVHPDFDARVDRNSLALYMRHSYVPTPYSIYQKIFKLAPGHWIDIPLSGPASNAKSARAQCYWSLNQAVEHGISHPFSGSPEHVVDALEARLTDAISDQMLADVPLGAFLSGGVDSSAVVALMQARSGRPVRTFTIGYEENQYNEAVFAKAVASHLGTDHAELYVKPEDSLAVIPRLPSIYCEPFADSSQIPTVLVSQLARQHVTVALSGDGGDELFGGYNRYLAARRVWGNMQRLPAAFRRMMALILQAVPPASWDRLFEVFKPLLPNRFQLAIPGEKARKLAGVLNLENEQAFFLQLTSQWDNPASVVIDAEEPLTLLTNSTEWANADCFQHWMMAMDARTYLPDDVLVKIDRAAMSASLETRVPFLDHRVVEFAWQLPLEMKIRGGEGKWALRQVLYRHVPKELIERPKMGFGVPLDSWLRGPLRDWAESLLDESLIRQQGYFNPEPIRRLWGQHLSGKRNWQYHLWTVLMFQAWLAEI